MAPPAPESEAEVRRQLGLAGLGFYASAALLVLTGCVFFFHVFFGLFTLLSPETFRDSSTGEPMPAFFGITMSSLGGCAIAAFRSMAVLFALAGGGLRTGRRRILVFITSILILSSFPLGTLLGGFTLWLLAKPETKRIFAA